MVEKWMELLIIISLIELYDSFVLYVQIFDCH